MNINEFVPKTDYKYTIYTGFIFLIIIISGIFYYLSKYDTISMFYNYVYIVLLLVPFVFSFIFINKYYN